MVGKGRPFADEGGGFVFRVAGRMDDHVGSHVWRRQADVVM